MSNGGGSFRPMHELMEMPFDQLLSTVEGSSHRQLPLAASSAGLWGGRAHPAHGATAWSGAAAPQPVGIVGTASRPHQVRWWPSTHVPLQLVLLAGSADTYGRSMLLSKVPLQIASRLMKSPDCATPPAVPASCRPAIPQADPPARARTRTCMRLHMLVHGHMCCPTCQRPPCVLRLFA